YGWCDPRLEDGVALDHAPRSRVADGPVQGVSHRADEAGRDSAGQERIGIEGDHVPHSWGHRRRAPADRDECRIARTREQAVELVELPALALPAHPCALARVPEPFAVEQEETRAAGRRGAIAS